MKKVVSLLLSLVMLVSITSESEVFAMDAYYEQESNNRIDYADYIKINSKMYGICGQGDIDYFCFQVSSRKRIRLDFSHEYSNCGGWQVSISNDAFHWSVYEPFYGDDETVYWLFDEYFENEKVYIQVKPYSYYGYAENVDYEISVYEVIQKPSNFKVSTRNTTNLKLSWSKVSGVTGYQLQRKVNGEYKTLTNTTSTSYTVKNLSAGTTYAFRVRAYKTIDGTKYYSGWKTLTTPTKPSKPSIKAPSTNKKHQIIAKWNKVSRCSGYQVQFSKKKNFSSVIATKTVSGQSKTSYTGNNFTKGKTYYVRVRSYKTVNDTKYYSAWSSVKSIKCK